MAISFYRTGDPAELADRLIALLESPEDQRRAAEQNYSAAIRMTMPHVVRHYLRWFELERRKRTFNFSTRTRFLDRWRHRSFRPATYGFPTDSPADWGLRRVLPEEETAPENVTGADQQHAPVKQFRTEG